MIISLFVVMVLRVLSTLFIEPIDSPLSYLNTILSIFYISINPSIVQYILSSTIIESLFV